MLPSSAQTGVPLQSPLQPTVSPVPTTKEQDLQPVNPAQGSRAAHHPLQSSSEHPALASSTYTTVTTLELPELPVDLDEFEPGTSTSTTSSSANLSASSTSSTTTALTPATVTVEIQLHDFEEIRAESKAIFNVLLETEDSVIQGYFVERPKAKTDEARGGNLSEYKKLRDATNYDSTTDIVKTAPYKALSKHRLVSLLENLLPPDSKFRSLLDPYTGGIRDPSTGLYAELQIVRHSNTYVLCFPGTGAGDMNTKQWKTNIKLLTGTGGVPKAHAQAVELARELSTIIKSSKKHGMSLELAGHSLGGGIANYVGMKLDLNATCFNAAALGPACLGDLKDVMSEDRIAKQTHIRIKGDVISSTKSHKKLASLLSGLDKNAELAPKHVGVIYVAGPDTPNYQKLGVIDRHLLSGFINLYKNPPQDENEKENKS